LKEYILKLNLYQPFAHYREPKVMQDDYIPTLNIPSPTTIAGMVSYVADKKFDSPFNIGVCCKYKTKDIHFIRGEDSEFYSKYLKQKKKKRLSYIDYKFTKSNRIMNFEVLQDVELTIFLKINNREDFELIKKSFENPKRYLVLGRKEDFVVKNKNANKIVEDITEKIKVINIKNKPMAIKNKYKIKNTYVPVDLQDRDYDSNNDEILRSGVLYDIPSIYKDIKADKTNRELSHSNYVYIDNSGYYPSKGEFLLYEDQMILYNWLVKDVIN
jgi:CRISPR-associated Cas5-like protein